MIPYGLRPILSTDLLPAGYSYISNAVFQVNAFLTAGEILRTPVSHTAAAIRRNIVEQGTREQMEALAAVTRKSRETTGWDPLPGTGNMHLFKLTNWTKARFSGTNFKSAILKSSREEGEQEKIGVPRMVLVGVSMNGLRARQAFPILGKDGEGNYWSMGILRKGDWKLMEQQIANIT